MPDPLWTAVGTRLLGASLFITIAVAAAPGVDYPVVFVDGEGVGLGASWRHVDFSRGLPGRGRATRYSLLFEAGRPILRASSLGGASALIHPLDLDPRVWPRLRWRWRARQLPSGADIHSREGDDYAARLYVTFAYDPARLSWGERLRYESIRIVEGDYPPLRAINYVWADHAPVGTLIANAYTARTMMRVMESGHEGLNAWREYEVDLVADYRQAFHEEPSRITGIAIMTDSDDTSSAAEADYADIRLLPGK